MNRIFGDCLGSLGFQDKTHAGWLSLVPPSTLPAAAAAATGAGAEGGELTLTDLIAGLGDSKAKLGAARKALERLEKKATPVSAPLPGPVRQRQERKAG